MLKVLLIDDDKINNFLNRSIIEKHYGNDYTVSEFINPEEAYDYLKNCALNNHENCPEIIFLDINMPEMSGFEFLEKMEAENVRLPETKIFILKLKESKNYIAGNSLINSAETLFKCCKTSTVPVHISAS
jgi:CheY-like chemotaxis protein